MSNFWKVILLNLNMFLCAWWFIFLLSQSISKQTHSNLFRKLGIFKIESSSSEIWDFQWHETFSVPPAFTTLILLLLFQIIKNVNVVVLILLFSNTTIIECFFYFFIWFSHGSLMEINSTHAHFRNRKMLYFSDEKQKDKNTFKDKIQSQYLIY